MIPLLLLVIVLWPTWAGALTYTCPYEVIHDTARIPSPGGWS